MGEVDGIHYFTMDYIEGEDLGQKIRSKVRLEAKEAVEYALEIADGLGYAHGFNTSGSNHLYFVAAASF